MTEEQIREILEKSRLFSGSRIPLDRVIVRSCRRGQILSGMWKGEPALGMVAEGMADAYCVALDGKEILLSQLGPGSCFGMVSLFSGADLPTVLRCRSRTTVFLIPAADFLEAMDRDRGLCLRFGELCSRKMLFLIRRIEVLSIQSARKKLIHYLLTCREEDGVIDMSLSGNETAALLGISRATFYREFSGLRRAGFLQGGSGRTRIADRKGLEALLYEICDQGEET